MFKKMTWRRAVGWILSVAILFFLGRTLWSTWDQVAQSGFVFQFNFPLLIVSVVLLVPGRVFGVEAWRRILGTLGNRITLQFATYSWFVSNLARFIPGNVFQVAAMMMLTESAGVSKLNVIFSQTIYAIIALSVAVLYGLTLVPFAQGDTALLLLAFAALIILFALPSVYQIILRVSTWLLRKVRRNKDLVAPRVQTTFWQGLVPPLCSFIFWTINGFAFWLFVRSITPLSWTAIPTFIGMNAAAYFVGYISFITPSGLGVREASLAFFLAPFFPPPVAVAIAFLTRLWSLAGEFLGVGLAVWWQSRAVKSAPVPAPSPAAPASAPGPGSVVK